MVQGAVGALDTLPGEARKSRGTINPSMVVEEGVLVESSLGTLLGNMLMFAEGFLSWLVLLDPLRCGLIFCWCPQAF